MTHAIISVICKWVLEYLHLPTGDGVSGTSEFISVGTDSRVHSTVLQLSNVFAVATKSGSLSSGDETCTDRNAKSETPGCGVREKLQRVDRVRDNLVDNTEGYFIPKKKSKVYSNEL
jgi:hypothetical protein